MPIRRPTFAPASAVAVFTVALLAACGGGTEPPPPPTSGCTDVTPTSLEVGAYTVIDPNVAGNCVRIPAAGGGGAEHLYVALSGAGAVTSNGVTAAYKLQGGAPATAKVAPLGGVAPVVGGFRATPGADRALAFHAMLRQRELAQRPSPFDGPNLNAGATLMLAPPVVGDVRTFKVCSTATCTGTPVTVTATARTVGQKVAIYVDNAAPTPGYGQATLDSLGTLFDQYLYPIDTTAFGRESDVDQNGVVQVLLTPQVNRLSGACNSTGSVILGYFFSADLIQNGGYNFGEIFYGLVPDPNAQAQPNCTISKTYAETFLAPTFIHEFQHMISYSQHRLAGGSSSEDTWLNEGLSHYAEELGGRLIPDQLCAGNSCLSQFALGDADNAYRYLRNPEEFFLVEPGSSQGSLEERGANWLFVRWLADHFGSFDPATNTNSALTRALVQTSKLGAANVEAVTGQPFSTLVSQWQLANYLDNLPGFTAADPKLQYLSWNFRGTYGSFHQQDPGNFPLEYPLVPDSTTDGAYARTGTLRAGSGRHVLVVQPGGGNAVDLLLTDQSGNLIATGAAPRIAVARIR
ncbi:MAG TPA: hypothetical protein VFS40_06865 [Gemmatimonadales bacterium]|nr:hypothetical protein [Gemmatimonadales bacterium]